MATFMEMVEDPAWGINGRIDQVGWNVDKLVEAGAMDKATADTIKALLPPHLPLPDLDSAE